MITFTMHTILFVSKLCTGPCKRHLKQNHIYVCVCVGGCVFECGRECVCACVCACVCVCIGWAPGAQANPWCLGVNLVLKQDFLCSAHIHIQIFSASGGSWLSLCGAVRVNLSLLYTTLLNPHRSIISQTILAWC